jgi:hypothetical protein
MCDTSDNVESAHHSWIVNPAKVRGGDRDVDHEQDDRGEASEPRQQLVEKHSALLMRIRSVILR